MYGAGTPITCYRVGLKTISRSQYSPSIMEVLRSKLGSSGLAAGTFTAKPSYLFKLIFAEFFSRISCQAGILRSKSITCILQMEALPLRQPPTPGRINNNICWAWMWKEVPSIITSEALLIMLPKHEIKKYFLHNLEYYSGILTDSIWENMENKRLSD